VDGRSYLTHSREASGTARCGGDFCEVGDRQLDVLPESLPRYHGKDFAGGGEEGRGFGPCRWTGLRSVTSVSDLCKLFEDLLGEESKVLGREMKD